MKKPIVIAICAAVVVVALVLSLLFVFSGKGKEPAPQENDFSIVGTWHIVANITKGVPVFVEDQYVTFDATKAHMYKDATDDAYEESSYTIRKDGYLVLNDTSAEYRMDCKTDNCIRLYDGADYYMLLVRSGTGERSVETVTAEYLSGRWNVNLKAGGRVLGEILDFENGTLNYYKDASAAPFATAEYTVADNVMTAASLGMAMRCYKISDSVAVLVQEDGLAWEITK